MTSTIHADKIMNSSGDQDSGLDLLVNDQVKIKTANTDRVTVTDATTSITNDLVVDTSTLKVDSANNRVGVGLTDPSELLEVSNSADTPTKISVTAEDSAGTNQNAFIKTKAKGNYYEGLEMASTTGHIGMWGGYHSGSAAVMQARIGGSSINSSDKLAIAIDANGTVTKSLQPGFMVGLSGGNVTGAGYVIFNNVYFNEGSHYNAGNGIFTAPVTGVYIFHAYLLLQNNLSLGDYYWSFTYNGSALAYCYQYNMIANKHFHMSNSIIYKMNANDTMRVYNHNAQWYGVAALHSQFHGYLLG